MLAAGPRPAHTLPRQSNPYRECEREAARLRARLRSRYGLTTSLQGQDPAIGSRPGVSNAGLAALEAQPHAVAHHQVDASRIALAGEPVVERRVASPQLAQKKSRA